MAYQRAIWFYLSLVSDLAAVVCALLLVELAIWKDHNDLNPMYLTDGRPDTAPHDLHVAYNLQVAVIVLGILALVSHGFNAALHQQSEPEKIIETLFRLYLVFGSVAVAFKLHAYLNSLGAPNYTSSGVKDTKFLVIPQILLFVPGLVRAARIKGPLDKIFPFP